MAGSAYSAREESSTQWALLFETFCPGLTARKRRPDRRTPKCACSTVSEFWLWLAGRLGRLRLGLLLGRSFLICREDRGVGNLPRGLDCLWSFREARRACR